MSDAPQHLVQMTYRDDRMPETLQVSMFSVSKRLWRKIRKAEQPNGGEPDDMTPTGVRLTEAEFLASLEDDEPASGSSEAPVIWCPCWESPEPAVPWTYPDDEHADVCGYGHRCPTECRWDECPAAHANDSSGD